ncbi:MAG: helicase-related protein, partial [Methylococcaceae bacterium]
MSENFMQWQTNGLVPDMLIEPGDKTNEPIRTRGWTHWHHMFAPRDLIFFAAWNKFNKPSNAIEVCRLIDRTSKLCGWVTTKNREAPSNVFANQAMNTMYDYCNYSALELIRLSEDTLRFSDSLNVHANVHAVEASKIQVNCDVFLTDPPYADAVMYHEITEFFIAWLRKNPPAPFNEWVWDSRRALAIKGSGDDFRRGMVEAYTAMTKHMPDNGMQCVMFTHQDTGVWSDTRQDFELELDRRVANAPFFQRENPFVRHVVLRKRTALEEAGLLKRVGVDVHPNVNRIKDIHGFNSLFEGLAVRTDEHFREAYNEARLFGKVLGKRGKGGGFMKNLMQQRICSSIVAGINTATALLGGRTLHEESDELEEDVALQTDEERAVLELLLHRLKQIAVDPKYEAVLHYLVNEGWLEHGCIIFSQYYDTARWLADALAARFSDEAIGLYAGAGRSRLYQKGDSVGIERETLKIMVAEHEIRIMVATDAACEGLNLQTLGALINVDLPWNPTKLEQRIGRIKRFGQVRDSVDMLNLVNEQTVDEKVYERLSERMRDKFNLFGSLPDTIKDEWIEDIETMDQEMDQYIEAQKRATGFDLRYNAHLSPSDKDWRD